MSDCSIGFEVELNEVYLLENDQDTNRNRGTEEDPYLDSTPGFFWQNDEKVSPYDINLELCSSWFTLISHNSPLFTNN